MNNESDGGYPSNPLRQVPLRVEPQTGYRTPNEWQPFAIFVVEFQSHLVDGQEQFRSKVHNFIDDLWASWPGIETQQLCQWMFDRATQELSRRPSARTN